MKSRNNVYLLLLSLFSLTACTDVVDVDLEKSEPLLAVDGQITDQPGPYTVRLSTTASYFSNTTTPAVTNATVVIRDSEGVSETLKQTTPGVYVTSQLRGKVGHKYTLTVKADGQEYTAETEIRRVFPLDSIAAEFRKESLGQEEGYYLKIYGQEIAGKGDSYRWKVYRNDSLLSKPADLIFFDDLYIDGNYLNGIALGNGPFKKGDKIRVENLSLTDDAYQYIVEIFNNTAATGGLFSNPPANVRTNIRNVAPNGKKAVGWFNGSAVRRVEKTI
ncbi:DUF4249 domain-containing protein [Tellurirhabdus rosea]|uniref:DUF4249 domain-containing protein n=1 Tax=Tellurirhabdus rosea TaxID=2674997 RepID=UPI0022512C9C|nr:DUF4249 domain-containing protein [Tellurirhabdus rosea]